MIEELVTVGLHLIQVPCGSFLFSMNIEHFKDDLGLPSCGL